ncbi:MAG: leucine-rich repeat domain-containing protein [Alphaproteobacteria bacterium]|nr:leucine-rich repeat domain-containing protein [Alphaproteobacteria bacterium]
MRTKFLILMLYFIAPKVSLADCNQPDWLDCGTTGDVSWSVSSDGKTLVISGQGNMENYTECEDNPYYDEHNPHSAQARTTAPWGKYSNQLENIKVEEGVISLGQRAFQGLDHVTDISLPNSLTSIGIQAFDRVKKLTNLVIPDSVASIGYAAFAWTSSLETVDIGNGIEVSDNRPFYAIGKIETTQQEEFGNGNQTTIYCLSGMCTNLDKDAYITKLVSYVRSGENYVLNGMRYKNSSDMQNNRAIAQKRIYSIEEATKLSKKTGNKFMLRYK